MLGGESQPIMPRDYTRFDYKSINIGSEKLLE
jgi:hypothetical protein